MIGRTLVFLLVLVASTASAQEAPKDILISRQLATEQGLSVGSIVRLAVDANGTGARTFRIAGIYEPTPDPARLGVVPREVRLHLPDLLDVMRPPGMLAGTEYVANINVALTDPADAAAFARDVNARMPGVIARPSSEAAGSAGPFRVIERFHLAIAIVTIVAATVFLLALSIMLMISSMTNKTESIHAEMLESSNIRMPRIALSIFLTSLKIPSTPRVPAMEPTLGSMSVRLSGNMVAEDIFIN